MYSYSQPLPMQVGVGDAQAAETVDVAGSAKTEGGKLTNVRVTAVTGVTGATPAAFTLQFGTAADPDLYGIYEVTADNLGAAGETLDGDLTLYTENFRADDDTPLLITCAAPAAAAADVYVAIAYY